MISGVSSSYASQLASTLFSKLDSKNQGYFEKLDLESALSSATSLSDTEDTLSIDDVFGQLDGDGDGKVTQDELTSSLQKLAEELDSQYNQMRMGGMGGMPPPPPQGMAGGQEDEGFSLEELQGQLEEMGTSDSRRSELISNIVDNFDEADSDGNGKVNFAEAMAFDQASRADSTASTATTAATATASSSGSQTDEEANLLRMVMELMRAYGSEAFQASQGGFSATA